jgi:NADPH:quinone reductase-like Zn-dependent oxidoreductase
VLGNLKFVPTDNRAPKVGEVEIRVLATGLNFRDVMDALGMYPGKNESFGLGVVGVVSRFGTGVAFKVGDARSLWAGSRHFSFIRHFGASSLGAQAYGRVF